MDKNKLSPALRRAQEKYNQKRITKIIRFNAETEADLIEALKHIPNFNGFVKQKIREFINESKS